MAILSSLVDFLSNASLTTNLLLSITAIIVLVAIYLLFLDPLRSVPGPLICRLTFLWTYYHSYIGDECTINNRLHAIYGPVLRIAPREVVIADGAALSPIYKDHGGFPKAPCYSNFDAEGHATIFSTQDASYRAARSKAVIPLFSTGTIRANAAAIERSVALFVQRLQREADASRKASSPSSASDPDERNVNVLNMSRSLALDSLTGYLLGRSYGGIGETGAKQLSASAFVDALVAANRFFYLPGWLFQLLEGTRLKYFVGAEEAESAAGVNGFARPLVEKASKDEDTFQGRLINADISLHETEVECKDVMFAGTDSTGMNLSFLLWSLAKNSDVYTNLRVAIREADAVDPNQNPQSIAYLDAVVREGLRLAMANPTRFPRQVPLSHNNGCGFTFTPTSTFHPGTTSSPSPPTSHQKPGSKTYTFPAGTLVGCSPYTLHLNANTFANPHVFDPARWLSPAEQQRYHTGAIPHPAGPTPEMQRDFIPFGLGPRQCIARNLAMAELLYAVRAFVRADCLKGAVAVPGLGPEGAIAITEWFNSRVLGGKIELRWT